MVADLADGIDGAVQLLAFAHQFLRGGGIVPDCGVFGQLDDFNQALLLGFEVKDTSAAPVTGCPGPASGWRSR